MDLEKEVHKPQLLSVIPTDVQLMIGILASDLKKVRDAMRICTNVAPFTTDAEREAWEYFAGPFNEFIVDTMKELENGSNSE